MTPLQVLLLAVVQGITEFLPISSSAHLVLVPVAFRWPDQGLTFDMATHVGSFVAIVAYLRRDVGRLLGAVPDVLRGRLEAGSDAFLLVGLALATVPVAVAGLLLHDFVGGTGRSPAVIAVTSIVYGVLLGVADRWGRRERSLGELSWLDVVVAGCFQALAVIPGTSRSGITMTAALVTGLRRRAAARLSFLMALPVMILVAALDVTEIVRGYEGAASAGDLLLGFAVAAVAAYLAVTWLMSWLEGRGMGIFVAYRVVLGLVILGFVGWG